jgi:plastocyanin
MGAAWREVIVNRFDPSNVTIPVGSEVIWSNQDKLSHTVTSGNASIGADGKFNPTSYVFTILFHTFFPNLEDIHIIASCIPG